MLSSTIFGLQAALFSGVLGDPLPPVPTLASQIQEEETRAYDFPNEAEDDGFQLPASSVPS